MAENTKASTRTTRRKALASSPSETEESMKASGKMESNTERESSVRKTSHARESGKTENAWSGLKKRNKTKNQTKVARRQYFKMNNDHSILCLQFLQSNRPLKMA
jgi:hypothetical protein